MEVFNRHASFWFFYILTVPWFTKSIENGALGDTHKHRTKMSQIIFDETFSRSIMKCLSWELPFYEFCLLGVGGKLSSKLIAKMTQTTNGRVGQKVLFLAHNLWQIPNGRWKAWCILCVVMAGCSRWFLSAVSLSGVKTLLRER